MNYAIMDIAVDCRIYKSARRAFLYLYLPADGAFENLPEGLRQWFGEPNFVMDLQLTPERLLANAQAPAVIAALQEQGFYLQLPPNEPLPI